MEAERRRARSGRNQRGDHRPILGVIKADIGIRDGKIVGIGKAGNPDTMNITPGLIVSPNTDILSVEGMI